MSRLHLFALKQGTPGHTGIGLWRHPEDRSHRYADLGELTALARGLEAAGFDGVFFADAPGPLDVYEGRVDAALADGIGSPSTDPIPAVAAMAAATRTLGFAVTASTSYVHPYALARTLGTLDLLTNGRVGWNIVTSSLESGARNLGLGELPSHDQRYDIAEEYLEVIYALLEGSWEDDAVVRDRERGLYADPARVHPVGHRGRWFSVPDIGPVEPTPQRTPVLFQAGSSRRGLAFAGRHAEGVFLSAMTAEVARMQRDRLHRATEEAGRDPAETVVLANATAIVAEDDAAAHRLFAEEYAPYVSYRGALARYSALLGIDLAGLDPDDPIESRESRGIQGLVDAFTALSDEPWTPRRIGEFVAIGGGGPVFVGGPSTVADALEDWRRRSGVTGFNLADPVPGCTLVEVCRLLAPELRARGLIAGPGGPAGSDAPSTLRQRLRGGGSPRLAAPHPAAEVRARYHG